MIVLDASVLIAYLDSADAHHERALALLLANADTPVATSAVTMAEALVGPARTGALNPVVKALDNLDVEAIPIDRSAATRLAGIRAESALKLPDCCVLLAAEQASANVATFDDRLARVARQRGLMVLG